MDNRALIFNIQKFSLNDGPGIRTVVFFKGCPLRCRWCSNPESQNPEYEELFLNEKCEFKTCDEILSVCKQDMDFYEESGGGVTLSGGEVYLQHDIALELLKVLKQSKIDTCIETTGFTSSEIFASFFPYLDHMLFDIKHYDDRKHTEGTGVSNSLILHNLRLAVENGVDVLPRLPVIPNYNDGVEDVSGFCSVLRKLGLFKVQLLPFHQYGERKYEYLNRDYLMRGYNSYHEEDLQKYRNIFNNEGIEAFF